MKNLSTESAEIILDLPMPPSTNRLWRHGRGHVYVSKEYRAWQKECDALALEKGYCKNKIAGPFQIDIQLAQNNRGDGDNRIKAVLDWLQRVEIIHNDSDCENGSWEWVPTAEAPLGCRVFVRATTHSA